MMESIMPYEWTCVTDHADFAPRDGAGALVFKDRMWLIGGWNPNDKVNFPRICNNEVWSSADGLSWNLEKKNTFLDESFDKQADWEGRHYATYAIFQDKMWVIGGDPNQGHYQKDVWNSTDGKNWTLVNNALPWGERYSPYSVVLNNKIWIMGGQTLPQFAEAEENLFNDIWSSPDGVHWEMKHSRGPIWTPRAFIGGSAVFQNKIWVLGGGTYETPKYPERQYYNDVWCTEDGVNWSRILDHASWKPREMHEVAVFDDKLWVLERFSGSNRNDVWYSDDGKSWHELPDTPWKSRHAASVFVFQNALWVVAGNNMESDVWKLEIRR